MPDNCRCVTEQEREQYNIAIAKEQTCVSEEDIRTMVEKRDKIISSPLKWNTFELFQSGIKETWYECPKCKWSSALLIPRNYCPNCGAKRGESEDKCKVDVLEKIRDEIEHLHYHPKLDFIKNDEVVEMALAIINKYADSISHTET